MKCAVYARVSTDNQAEVEFNSCEAQEAKIRSFIQSQENMELVRVYSDPGFSGATLTRPALNEMLADICNHKINLVIAYKIDRLTRSPKDFYQLIELFDKYGVDFISVTERFDTSTPSGRLLRNIMLTFAQFERELTSERTRDKLLERAQKGMWNGGFVPFGYKAVNKRLVPDEEKFQRLKRIFEIFAERGSLAKTYQLLKDQRIYNDKGLPFSKPHLQSILRNIIYTGKLKYADKIYRGRHQPLISEDLFNRVQGFRNVKVRKMRLYKDYVLGGLIKCAECDSHMTPCHTNKKIHGRKRHYYYYRCTKTFKRDWNSCNTRQVSANRLEDYILKNLDRISNDRHYIDSLIFKLNNEVSGDRKGLELNKECPKISPEIFADNLKSFLDGLPKRKGTERNLWTQKFIKRIVYSKKEIVITLYYVKDFEKETAVYPASGRVGAAAGHSLSFGAGKKIIPIGTYRDNRQQWLPPEDSNLRHGGYELT
ncbi:MAG: recombinase family protein [Candidatus Omnitrophica bacterium]|nr:recombinase family protein [Candidatus Omnitrophota bacterium]